MLKIKDGVNLKELEKYGFEKQGGTKQEHYYFYWYVKFIETIFGKVYEIRIDVNNNRRLTIGELICPPYDYRDKNSTHYRNQNDVTYRKKRYIKDLIKADLVEKV